MKEIDRYYDLEECDFCADYSGYVVDTNQVNLKNWLVKNISDDGNVYEAIKSTVLDIFVLTNLNVDEEFQGEGYGSEILNDALIEADCDTVILLCDTSETQREGFNLEFFYQN